jgi:hypothetical protein
MDCIEKVGISAHFDLIQLEFLLQLEMSIELH